MRPMLAIDSIITNREAKKMRVPHCAVDMVTDTSRVCRSFVRRQNMEVGMGVKAGGKIYGVSFLINHNLKFYKH
jgi:hypothetical protein